MKRITGHSWVDSIHRGRDGAWKLQLLNSAPEGWTTKQISADEDALEILDDCIKISRMLRTATLPLSKVNLAFAEEVVAPSGLIKRLVPGIPATDHHAIYKLDGETPIYVPALLLIQALYMGEKQLNRALFMPNGIDLLARLGGDSALPQIRFRKYAYQKPSGRFVRSLAWLLSSNQARISHASVLASAREGRIALRNPEILLSGWVRGIELGDIGLLAFSLGSVHLTYPVSYSEILVNIGERTHVYSSKVPINPSPWSSAYEAAYSDDGYDDTAKAICRKI